MAEEMPVSVDRDFARFGAKSYAIKQINSVEVRRRYPNGQGAMFVFGLLAVICVVSGAAAGGSGVLIAVGLLSGVLAFGFWQRSKIIEYQLFLMTSSSETQAISSRDPGTIDALRDRIEQAIAGKLAA